MRKILFIAFAVFMLVSCKEHENFDIIIGDEPTPIPVAVNPAVNLSVVWNEETGNNYITVPASGAEFNVTHTDERSAFFANFMSIYFTDNGKKTEATRTDDGVSCVGSWYSINGIGKDNLVKVSVSENVSSSPRTVSFVTSTGMPFCAQVVITQLGRN